MIKQIMGMISLMIILSASTISSGAELLIPPSATGTEFLNDQILTDQTTVADPERVYVLERDGIYLWNALLTNTGWVLRIKAAEGDGNKPLIYLVTNSTTGIFPSHFIEMGEDLWLKNVSLVGFIEELPDQIYNDPPRLIRSRAAGFDLILDGCIITSSRGEHIRLEQATRVVKITNCIFGNMGDLGTSNLGAGKPIDFRNASCDSAIFINNTFVNFQDRIVRHRMSVAPIHYFEFDHNTLVNSMGYHGTLVLGWLGEKAIITNNLFIDTFIAGADTDKVRQSEFDESGEKDPRNGLGRMTWVISVPNDTTEWTVSGNFYSVSKAVSDFYKAHQAEGVLGEGPALTYHINSRLGADSTKAFTKASITLTERPDPMVNMAEWYRSPEGGKKTKNTPCACWNRETDDYDRRVIGFYRDTLDCSYPVTSAAYHGAENGYPAGDLNWFPNFLNPQVATPDLSPSPGTYTTGQNVTITCPTAGATIYYTTNGTDPTESDATYSSPVPITSTTTLKARAYKSMWQASGIASGVYTITGTVAMPAFSPSPGTYTTGRNVTITCPTPEVVIHYTTNNLDPTESDAVYSNPVSITGTTTLKARAYKSTWQTSGIASGVYTITGTVATPVLNPPPGTYTTGQNVTITCPTPEVVIHYTTNNLDPTESDATYSSPVPITGTTTLKARAYKSGWKESEVAGGLYTITGTVATPVLNPPPGTYTTGQNVTITCPTPEVVIHYTTNNLDPTESDATYSSPVPVTGTTTLKARAYKSGWKESGVAGGIYTITDLDAAPPDIILSLPDNAAYSQSKSISTTVTDNTEVSDVLLYYRQGGKTSFNSLQMNLTGGNTYQGTIPSGSVTERGMEYYISATDPSGNTSTEPESNAAESPYSVQVSYTSLNYPYTTPANSYRMISIPGEMDNKTPASVFEDDFGAYDRTQWRLMRGQNGNYVEYTIGSLENFYPGKAFWLITKDTESWDAGSGKSVTTSEDYSITLQPGWNQIGNPFAFTVNWSDVVKHGTIQAPVAYDVTGNNASGYQYNQTQLLPWKGYCVYNDVAQTTTIEIPAKEAAGTAKAVGPLARSLDSGEWMAQIKALCGHSSDMDNYLGFLSDANEEWDTNDIREAPPIGDYVLVLFPHYEWEKHSGEYAGDFRPVNDQGHEWKFVVDNNIPHSPVRLFFEGFNLLPEENEAILIDETIHCSQNLKDAVEYTYLSGSKESQRSFRLIIGNDQFVEENTKDIPASPTDYKFLPNYPNPFNASTTIQYTIPAQTRINIDVFDMLGRHIKTLEKDTPKEAGYHIVIWDGKNQEGLTVTSGVYIVQLKTNIFIRQRKLVLTK